MNKIKLTPNLPQTLPAQPLQIEWIPGNNTGMRLYAALSPRGGGHMLLWDVGIRRTYDTGKQIAGTAARATIRITIGAIPARGWIAKIEGEHTAPLTLKGDGDLAAAVAAIEDKIIPYAKSLRPLTLSGATAIPAALTCPTGGELIAL